eukprot:g74667.t1
MAGPIASPFGVTKQTRPGRKNRPQARRRSDSSSSSSQRYVTLYNGRDLAASMAKRASPKKKMAEKEKEKERLLREEGNNGRGGEERKQSKQQQQSASSKDITTYVDISPKKNSKKRKSRTPTPDKKEAQGKTDNSRQLDFPMTSEACDAEKKLQPSSAKQRLDLRIRRKLSTSTKKKKRSVTPSPPPSHPCLSPEESIEPEKDHIASRRLERDGSRDLALLPTGCPTLETHASEFKTKPQQLPFRVVVPPVNTSPTKSKTATTSCSSSNVNPTATRNLPQVEEEPSPGFSQLHPSASNEMQTVTTPSPHNLAGESPTFTLHMPK